MYVHLCCLNLPLFTYPRFDMNRHTHSFEKMILYRSIYTNISNFNILQTIGPHKKENIVEAHTFEEIYMKTKEHGDSFL